MSYEMTDPVWRDEDRKYLETRFEEISERLTYKGFIPSSHKREFRINTEDGRVFKFTVTGYLKKGSVADLKHKSELEGFQKEFDAIDGNK
jgi:hypothetical protein